MAKHTDKEISKLMENANKKLRIVFKQHGMAIHRKIGLRRAIQNLMVEAATTGTISPV